jgi:hypothetical protein
MSKLALAASAAFVVVTACPSTPSGTCADGTALKDGKCVSTTTCGAGTTLKNGVCVATAPPSTFSCGAGTIANSTNTACVPLCAAPFVFSGTACACPTGFVQNGTSCGPDPALCPDGTAFDTASGHCLAIPAPTPTDDDRNGGQPVGIALPAAGLSVTVGGVLDPQPTGGADTDVWFFDATAGERLFIQVIGNGVAAPQFTLTGTGALLNRYSRGATAVTNNRATRHVDIPLDGRYVLAVSADALGFVGSPDAAYTIVIDVDTTPAPSDAAADGSVHQDGLDALPSYRIATDSAAAGDLVTATLAPLDGVSEVLWTVTADGTFIEAAPASGLVLNAVLPQTSSGLVLHVDYVEADVSAAVSSSFSATKTAAVAGPTTATSPVVVDVGDTSIAAFSFALSANHVHRIRAEIPDDSSFDFISGALFGSAGDQIGSCGNTTADGKRTVECKVLAPADDTATLLFATNTPHAHLFANTQVRLSLDEAPVDTHTLSLAGGAQHLTVAQPANAPDSFAGPWLLVSASELMNLEISEASPTAAIVFDFRFGNPLAASADVGLLRTPGSKLLVELIRGLGVGTTTVDLTPSASGFAQESEPNDDVAHANPIPPPPPPLPAPSACDVNAPVTTSGITKLDFRALPDDVQNGSTCAFPSNDPSGGDAVFLVGPHPAGTSLDIVLTGDLGPELAASVAFLVDSCTATCTAPTIGSGHYVFNGTEQRVFVVVDSDLFTIGGFPVPMSLQLSDAPFVKGEFGLLADGATDVFSLALPSAGAFDVTVSGAFDTNFEGAFQFLDASGAPLSAQSVVDVSAFPNDLGRIFVRSAGTVFLVVNDQFALGVPDPQSYFLTWSFDANAVAPPAGDCSAPFDITSQLAPQGPQRVLSLELTSQTAGGFSPDPATCFGGDVFDVPAQNEQAFLVDMPPQTQLDVGDAVGGLATRLAILDGSCSSSCLASVRGDFADLSASVKNPSATDVKPVVVVVSSTAVAGHFVTFTLTPDACELGSTRCDDANTLATCTDGVSFSSETCGAGCTADAFELSASCNKVCGFDGTGNLIGPLEICNGKTIQSCNAQGTAYVDTATCDVKCAEVSPSSAQCRFGVCTSGTSSCDVVNGVAIASSCNTDESVLDQTSCASNACFATTCAPPPAPPSFSAPAPDTGACNLASAARLDSTGSYAIATPTPAGDDFNVGNFLACGSTSGDDVFFVVAARAAGVTVTIAPRFASPPPDPSTTMSLSNSVDCASGNGRCDGEIPLFAEAAALSHTFQAGDGDLLLLFDGTLPPELDFALTYSDDLPQPTPFCTAPASCANGALTTCAQNGTEEITSHCAAGCNATNDGCGVVGSGETCASPFIVDLSQAPATFDIDLSNFADDIQSCVPGGDAMFDVKVPPTATGNSSITVTAFATRPGDSFGVTFEGVCGQITTGLCFNTSDPQAPPFGQGLQLGFQPGQPPPTDTFFVFDGAVPIHVAFTFQQ